MPSEQFFPPFFKYKRFIFINIISNGMYSLLLYVLLHPELPLYPSYQRNPGLMPRADRSSRSILHDCWVCLFVCFSHCKTESKLLPDRVPWRLKLPYLSPIGCSASYLFSHILLRLSSLGSLQPLNAISPCRRSDSQQSVLHSLPLRPTTSRPSSQKSPPSGSSS